MNNLANLPDSNFDFQPQNTIFDDTQKYSPYNWIKTAQQMGFTEPTPILNGYDISQNLAGLQIYGQYSNLQFYGTPSTAASQDSLGNRYFVNTNTKCFAPIENKMVDKHYVIDGLVTNGLAISAADSLDAIDPNNISNFYTSSGSTDDITLNNTDDVLNNACIKVQITTNKNGDTTDNYISLNEWKRIAPYGYANAKESFQNNCDDNIYMEAADFEDEPQPKKQQAMDIISGFFLGSITVLGLYIVFRFMEKTANKMRRLR